MARKGWDQLSAKYRARLEKNGVSKRQYERGESIQGARGHAKTPERPQGAAAFPDYLRERTKYVDAIVAKKHFYFGTSPKWNPQQGRKPFDRMPPPMRLLRLWASFTKEEWLNAIRENPESAAYLGYH